MHIKRIALLIALGLTTQAANASSAAVIYDYTVGGGNPLLGSATDAGVEINPEIAWSNRLSCTEFSLDNSLEAGFDSGQVKQMQTHIIGHLKNVFNPIGLIGTAIRRADPGLYETIMNGTAGIKEDFDIGLESCQQAQANIADLVMGGQNKTIAEANRWEMHAAKANSGKFDIINDTDTSGLGDDGVKIAGEMKGGVGQSPIKTIADTTRIGFNTLTGRLLNDMSTLKGAKTESGYGFGSGGGGNAGINGGVDLLLKDGVAQAFPNPNEAAAFLVQTVGESTMRTCEGCPPIESQPGQGAKVELDKERVEILANLNKLLAKSIRSITITDLNTVSAGSSVRVTKEVIEELKKMPATVRAGYLQSLASDIATARTVDKLLFARQILASGRQESSLAANAAIQDDMDRKIALLDDELDTIEREIRIKRYMTKNTAIAILERAGVTNRDEVVDSGKIL